MKILFAFLALVVVSCTDAGDRYVKRFEMVDISKRLIPDTATILDYMEIKAKAQAENSCWRKLYFELKKTKEFEYTLKAYGTFESFGVCDNGMVYQDTTIVFQPTQKGTYLFYISRVPNKTEVDTMIVK